MKGPDGEMPLIPARILNEYIYCPRLAYLMWVQGEFAPNVYTVDGSIRHRNVDAGGGTLPEKPEDEEVIHARSVFLSSTHLGLIAKIDLVEGNGSVVTPVDYKRGKRPHVAGGVYDPERVQLCAQGLLLREHGFTCHEGMIYYVGSRERVRVTFDEALKEKVHKAVQDMRDLVANGEIPPPLEDSPKCPHCSLIGICLPDEVRFLCHLSQKPRPILPAAENALPLIIQSPRAYVRKQGELFIIEEKGDEVGRCRLSEVSQVVLFGAASLSAPALQECFRREIPVTWMTFGGWFLGHTVGTGYRNVETRTWQYRRSFDPQVCLHLAKRWVVAKMANGRTLLRRNWRNESGEREAKMPSELHQSLTMLMRQAMKAPSMEVLLGTEGAGANLYFQNFSRMLKGEQGASRAFDFKTRNRRPPKDPVNALLSLAYAMLTREWTVTLSAVGLDPYRGFYHQPRFGRPSLALDMMEPFRPLVADSAVITAINNGEVHEKDFLSAAGSCTLKESGRKRFIAVFERRIQQQVTHPIFGYRVTYRQLFEVQARLLVRYLMGEIPSYPNFVTR